MRDGRSPCQQSMDLPGRDDRRCAVQRCVRALDRFPLMIVVGVGLACLGVAAGYGHLSPSHFSVVVGMFMIGAAAAHKIIR